MKDWKPRRFGGGKGTTRTTRTKGQKIKKVTEADFYDESRGYNTATTTGKKRSRSPRTRKR